MLQSLCVLVPLALLTLIPDAVQPLRRNRNRAPLNITAESGLDVDLKCRVRFHDCGNFHSIKWYKEPLEKDEREEGEGRVQAERVYMYYHGQGKAKAEGSWKGRASHAYDGKRNVMRLPLPWTGLLGAGGLLRLLLH